VPLDRRCMHDNSDDMTMSFPEVGPSWFSTLFYAALSAWIRAHELLFAALDMLFGWAYSTEGVS